MASGEGLLVRWVLRQDEEAKIVSGPYNTQANMLRWLCFLNRAYSRTRPLGPHWPGLPGLHVAEQRNDKDARCVEGQSRHESGCTTVHHRM